MIHSIPLNHDISLLNIYWRWLDSVRVELIYRQRSDDIPFDSIDLTLDSFTHSILVERHWYWIDLWHWLDWEGWHYIVPSAAHYHYYYYHFVSVPLAGYFFIRSLYLVPFTCMHRLRFILVIGTGIKHDLVLYGRPVIWTFDGPILQQVLYQF